MAILAANKLILSNARKYLMWKKNQIKYIAHLNFIQNSKNPTTCKKIKKYAKPIL